MEISQTYLENLGCVGVCLVSELRVLLWGEISGVQQKTEEESNNNNNRNNRAAVVC